MRDTEADVPAEDQTSPDPLSDGLDLPDDFWKCVGLLVVFALALIVVAGWGRKIMEALGW